MTAVKCLVWDLDDTLWDGVVLEGDRPRPFPAARSTLHTLDRRGILHAVASRGDHAVAAAHLAAHDLTDLFCVLEVGWGAKSEAIRRIATELNIGLDTVAFADNDAVERAEVTAALPMVRCYPAAEVGALPALPEFQPDVVTDESRHRRLYYQSNRHRTVAEREFSGSPTEFQTWLNLSMTVRPATEADLARAHELTIRTHQLNTTGRTFDLDELRTLSHSPHHQVLVATLTDRFGPHGTIGLAVLSHTRTDAVLDLLLMSCRVMSRNVGTALLTHLIRTTLATGRRPLAHFVPTPVNRIMLITLRFAGFTLLTEEPDHLLLTFDPNRPPPPPPTHVHINHPMATPPVL
ncbi:MAG TPA: HAD-IIIC family phosphatase [Actinophytocola sp.]|uniref:HAD-IIIC family phosphatase n=1 Tax=Actinophytocola sp. TaxID=1872138 RepID=UPI002DBFEABC|nr:HAD-IIIC family phosphatase [Actinophytocola sp.]HEU5470740.1 HAD-IIIC family phosphatase [Actinophytocola sp.]